MRCHLSIDMPYCQPSCLIKEWHGILLTKYDEKENNLSKLPKNLVRATFYGEQYNINNNKLLLTTVEIRF